MNECFEKLRHELDDLFCGKDSIYEENEDGIFVDVTDAFEPF
jgi:hypothetical protein